MLKVWPTLVVSAVNAVALNGPTQSAGITHRFICQTPTFALPLPLPLPIDSADAETVRADRIAAASMMLFMTFCLVVVLNVSADTKMTETTQQGCRQKRRRNIGADRHGLSVFQLMP